jgi:hypothetical protein
MGRERPQRYVGRVIQQKAASVPQMPVHPVAIAQLEIPGFNTPQRETKPDKLRAV